MSTGINVRVSLPQALYNAGHIARRHHLIYADDFFNVKSGHNWFPRLSGNGGAETRITNYLSTRPTGTIANPLAHTPGRMTATGATFDTARTINITSWQLPNFRTGPGEFMNYDIYLKVANFIYDDYEHYVPSTGVPAGIKTISTSNIDNLVQSIISMTVDVENIQDVLNGNIHSVTNSQKWLQIQEEKELNPAKDQDQEIVITNPDMSNFGILPSIVGEDMVNKTGGDFGASRYSQEFIVGSMIGWKFSGFSRRSVGSPEDFMAILMDVLYQQMDTNIPALGVLNAPADVTSGIIGTVMPRFNKLLVEPIIAQLSTVKGDFTGIVPSPNNPQNDYPLGSQLNRNPMVTGIITDLNGYPERRYPDFLLLQSIYRVVRTPFYNRDAVSRSDLTLADYLNFVGFRIDFDPAPGGGGGGPEFQLRLIQTAVTTADVDVIWDRLFGILPRPNPTNFPEGYGNVGKALDPREGSLPGIVTQGTTEDININRVKTKIIEFLDQMADKTIISDYQRKAILTGALNGLIWTMFHVGCQNWSMLGEQLNPPAAGDGTLTGNSYEIAFGPNLVQYNLGTFGDNMSNVDHAFYFSQSNTMRQTFGLRPGQAMGCMSLTWSSTIEASRMGEQVSYPGDASIFEGMGQYVNMWTSDITKISENLKFALRRLAHQFWWRDLQRWIEIIYQVLRPIAVTGAPDAIKKAHFDTLKGVISSLYSKQILIIQKYISQIGSLRPTTRITPGAVSTPTEDPSRSRARKVATLYATRVLCYLKRQELAFYYILSLMQSRPPWITAYPTMPRRNSILRAQASTAFRAAVQAFVQSLPDPDMGRMAKRMLLTDFCDKLPGENVGPARQFEVATQYITDDTIATVSNPNFWKLLSRNLKDNQDMSLDETNNSFYGIYVPVFISATFGNSRKYYLFDIMPFVLDDSLNSSSRSKPQWLASGDVASTHSFPPTNPAVVIVSDKTSQLDDSKRWKAVDVKWLQKLQSQALARASKVQGDSVARANRKKSIIRMGMYLLFRDSSLFRVAAGVDVGSRSSDLITPPGGGPRQDRLRYELNRIFLADPQQMATERRVFELISRESIERNMDISKTELLALGS